MNVFVSEAIAKGVLGKTGRSALATRLPATPTQRLPSGSRTAAATPGAPWVESQRSRRAWSLVASSGSTGGRVCVWATLPLAASVTRSTAVSSAARTRGSLWGVTARRGYRHSRDVSCGASVLEADAVDDAWALLSSRQPERWPSG